LLTSRSPSLNTRRGTHDIFGACYGNDETYQSHPAIKKELGVITKVLNLQLAFKKKKGMMAAACLLEVIRAL